MTQRAKELRKSILTISNQKRSAHIGSNLSCIDILSTLYFEIMDMPDFNDKKAFAKRDIFILSKAHSALALYVTLYHKGFLSKEILNGYYTQTLPAHTDRNTNPYVEISAGSLGHGLPIALGVAYSIKGKLNNTGEKRKVFVLMGDGESQEGSVWEAAMLAPKLGLDNLVVLVDFNNLQGYGRSKELVSFEPIDEKFRSFGFDCVRVNGHDEMAIIESVKLLKDKPLCVICETTKGKGVSFMEDKLEWHYYGISDDELKVALEELK